MAAHDIAWLEKYVMAEIKALHAKIDAGFAAMDKALQLADTENKRRDDELNHAHARAAEAARSTVSRELFDAARRDDALRREEVAKRVTEFREHQATAIATLKETLSADIAFRAGEAKSKAATIAVLISVAGVLVSVLTAIIAGFLR